ncbi:MAG: hypothetical protein ACXWTR_03925 [Methylotenera sp.]
MTQQRNTPNTSGTMLETEIKTVLIKLFPQGQNQTLAAKKLQEAAKNAPPPTNPKVYKNKHDELGDLIIGLSGILTEAEFAQLPDWML